MRNIEEFTLSRGFVKLLIGISSKSTVISKQLSRESWFMATEEQAVGGVKRVMGIFAHPDDPEFFCGATFARWAAEGAEIVFVLATSGDKGSSDPEMTSERLVQIREQEERNAAKALG